MTGDQIFHLLVGFITLLYSIGALRSHYFAYQIGMGKGIATLQLKTTTARVFSSFGIIGSLMILLPVFYRVVTGDKNITGDVTSFTTGLGVGVAILGVIIGTILQLAIDLGEFIGKYRDKQKR
jgi:hypothetical protein